jgi:alpha-galactosidase
MTSPRIGNESTLIWLEGSADCLWGYVPEATHVLRPVAAPVFEIDGKRMAAELTDVREVAPAAKLSNGCTEHRVAGTFADDAGLSLEMVFRLAPGNPVVRFQYLLRSASPRRLTKRGGAPVRPRAADVGGTGYRLDQLSYLAVELSGFASVKEVRFSEFDETVHSYRCTERAAGEKDFAAGVSLMGPLLAATDANSGESLLVAYEHGSTVPFAFLAFALDASRGATLQAVKGNYSTDQLVDAEHPFETIWFDLATVTGGEDELARAFREFVLKYQSLAAATRRPYIFYNTWCFQERNKWYRGKKYLDSMNERRILSEIDAAHRLGIDVFVLDTGWYEKTGDWRVNEGRFPDDLKSVRDRLASYGMKLGLWFGPPHAAGSSRALAEHQDCLMSQGGVPNPPQEIWETETSCDLCLVSRWADAFADELIRLSREVGVTYFKWDAVQQYGCDDPGHGHGDASTSREERADRYAFEQPRFLARIAERVSRACPEAICDFDVTESHRCVGLAFLSAGKYFLINNGPYFFNLDYPRDNTRWINVFVHPGPARARVCRRPIGYDRWIPSVLFLTHFLPDDPAESQWVNVASLILGQNGIWGDLPAVSKEGTDLIGRLIALYKQVRDDVTEAFPVRSGEVGANPEIHEKINAKTGRGAVVVFSSVSGQYTYVTANAADRKFSAPDDTEVTFTADGRAKIVATFPTRRGGAKIVFFGVTG